MNDTLVQMNQYNLVHDEILFFSELIRQGQQAFPYQFHATRSSVGAPFSVMLEDWGYVGKVFIRPPEIKYAVMKKGNIKATKVFKTMEEAETLSAQFPESRIETRTERDERFMQIQYAYFKPPVKNTTTVEEVLDDFRNQLLKNYERIEYINGVDLNTYISHIPQWIEYCQNYLIPAHFYVFR